MILLALAGCHSHPRSGKESGGAAPAPRPPDAAMSGVSSAPLALSANLPVQKPASAGKAAPPLSPQGRALLKRGVAAYEADDPATAIKAFEQMIQSDPQAPIARAYLGLLYVRQKRYADALKQFQEERKRLPNPAVAWAHIADVYYAQGDLPAAIRSLEKAAALQPDLAQVYFNLGMLYPQTLDLNRGIWALDRYLALKPDDDYAHYLRGNQLYKLAHLDEAEQAIEQAIRLAPQNGLYHYALAQVYLKRTVSPETTERALAELQRALALDAPEPAAVHYHLGLCYQRKGDWEAARRELEASVSMAP
ncbi:MAG TPA: tetratricopeptide repeat protein, partial [Chthonomonadaceae bacterium]|nr:tetratricopeptide repeat protein [Chthonomonadaceae bacterium]